MGRSDYYLSGGNNGICDRCGFKYKTKDLKKTWDGYWVCNKDWEPRHPQDFIRGVRDNVQPAISRPESTDVFIGP